VNQKCLVPSFSAIALLKVHKSIDGKNILAVNAIFSIQCKSLQKLNTKLPSNNSIQVSLKSQKLNGIYLSLDPPHGCAYA
jgi:hypothetical protein